MEEFVKATAEETSKQLLKNMNVNITLDGWPCAITVVGLGIAYVASVKIKCDSQRQAIGSKND